MSRPTAKVFETGRSQAVRLPKAYRFDCDEVLIERDGHRLILTPKPRRLGDYFGNPNFRRLGGDVSAPADAPAENIQPL